MGEGFEPKPLTSHMLAPPHIIQWANMSTLYVHLVKRHTMKTYGSEEVIFKLGTRWR
jgi:hypothetical protein